MKSYFPKKQRPWAMLSLVLKSSIYLLRHWPLLLLVAAFVSPISPHVMVSYSFRDYTLRHKWTECDYLGVRGFVNALPGGYCPAIAMIDRRDHH